MIAYTVGGGHLRGLTPYTCRARSLSYSKKNSNHGVDKAKKINCDDVDDK